MISNITLQHYEDKLKKFACYGLISQRQLSEILSFHNFRTRDNTLLTQIVFNPFFQANNHELQRAFAAQKLDAGPSDDIEKGKIVEVDDKFENDDELNMAIAVENMDESIKEEELTLGNAEVKAAGPKQVSWQHRGASILEHSAESQQIDIEIDLSIYNRIQK